MTKMNYHNNAFGFVLIAVAMASQIGCALLPPALQRKDSIVETPKIEVEKWLGSKTSIPIDPTTTFMSVIGSRANVEHHILLRAMREKFDEPQLEDNCVALVRGDENWYFVRPLELGSVYGLTFPMKANDRLITLPIERTVFHVPQPSDMFQYIRIDPDGTSNAVTVKPSEIMNIWQPQMKANAYNATCMVLTRFSGTTAHRLVLPLPAQFEDVLKQEIGGQLSPIFLQTFKNGGLYLQPGDIVEFSNPTLLAKKLGG